MEADLKSDRLGIRGDGERGAEQARAGRASISASRVSRASPTRLTSRGA